MVTGSEILENEKGPANVGLTEIVVIAAIDMPAKNSFIISPPPLIAQICAFGRKKGWYILLGCCPQFSREKSIGLSFRQYVKQDECHESYFAVLFFYLNYCELY